MKFAKKLKTLRTSNNYTQKEFAIIVNIAEQSYQRLEYDKNTPRGVGDAKTL